MTKYPLIEGLVIKLYTDYLGNHYIWPDDQSFTAQRALEEIRDLLDEKKQAGE